MPIRRATALVAFVVVLATVALAAPAGAATVSPGSWAPKFCTALSTWKDALTTGADNTESTLSGGITNLSQAKSEVVSFLGRSVKQTDTAVSSLKKAGVPSTTNGKKIASTFVNGLQSASDLFASAKKKAQNIPTSNPAKFKASAQSVTTALNNGSKKVSDSFSDVSKLDKKGELSTALQAEPSCAFLSGDSSGS